MHQNMNIKLIDVKVTNYFQGSFIQKALNGWPHNLDNGIEIAKQTARTKSTGKWLHVSVRRKLRLVSKFISQQYVLRFFTAIAKFIFSNKFWY